MKFLRAILLIVLFTGRSEATPVNAYSVANLIKALNTLGGHYDSLSKRIILKKLGNMKLTIHQWRVLRTYVLRNPQFGYDLTYKWDKIEPEGAIKTTEEKLINTQIDSADQWMLQEKFNKAFRTYQKAAKVLKKDLKDAGSENAFLYYSVIHSMGRALYGAKRFDEATTVLGWVNQRYPRFRQVLFEKMWSAFRSGHLDQAMGAIVAQKSSYFSSFIEPEAYLVEAYIWKKLCRENQLKDLRGEMDVLLKKMALDTPEVFEEWAHSDIEYLSLSKLTKLDYEKINPGVVTVQERKQEGAKIEVILRKKFNSDRMRLKKGLESTMAYSFIAMGSKDLSFFKHEVLDREALLAKGDELWVFDKNEDWIDELGGHLFIGDSECKK